MSCVEKGGEERFCGRASALSKSGGETEKEKNRSSHFHPQSSPAIFRFFCSLSYLERRLRRLFEGPGRAEEGSEPGWGGRLPSKKLCLSSSMGATSRECDDDEKEKKKLLESFLCLQLLSSTMTREEALVLVSARSGRDGTCAAEEAEQHRRAGCVFFLLSAFGFPFVF